MKTAGTPGDGAEPGRRLYRRGTVIADLALEGGIDTDPDALHVIAGAAIAGALPDPTLRVITQGEADSPAQNRVAVLLGFVRSRGWVASTSADPSQLHSLSNWTEDERA